MNVRCVDCGLEMGPHEMVSHDCPAPGQTRLLDELDKEQTNAASEPNTTAGGQAERPREADSGPDGGA
jgi:hypothetical protein